MTLTHGSLFAGGGGFDIAAEWCGISTRWQVECDPYCQQTLRQLFPEATLYDDITTLNLNQLEKVDIITGGFPCQPFSTAGKRRGAEDDRYLWPAMLEVIKHVGPTWVIVENVVGIKSMALPIFMAEVEGETVLLRVIRDLIRAGYSLPTEHDGTPVVYDIPAAGVGASHVRDRIWIIAYASGERECSKHRPGAANAGRKKCVESSKTWGNTLDQNSSAAADALSFGKLESQRGEQKKWGWIGNRADWSIKWPEVAARLCRVDDGISRGGDATRHDRKKEKQQQGSPI